MHKANNRKKHKKILKKSDWQSDIETRRYYYDDSYNYKIYKPEDSDEEEDEDTEKRENCLGFG